MYSAIRQSVFALLLAAVAGCGQMGPLYLPETPTAATPETATEDPATAADAAKPEDEEG